MKTPKSREPQVLGHKKPAKSEARCSNHKVADLVLQHSWCWRLPLPLREIPFVLSLFYRARLFFI